MYIQKFYELFNDGFDLYLCGKWEEARKYFEQIELVKGQEDLPTRNLMEIMAE